MSRHPLPPEAIADMCRRRLRGETLREIAEVWDTTDEHVRRVVAREAEKRDYRRAA